MHDRYEFVTGWLVMKAFFGWIRARRSADHSNDSEGHDVLNRYNSFLIGNLLSLLIGIAVGITARWLVMIYDA